MKNNKAHGTDNQTSDVMIPGGKKSVKQITKIVDQILEAKKTPVEWKEAKMITLHRQKETGKTNIYRPVSLLSLMYKLFTRILQKQMEKVLHENQPREQAGFRKGYSTIDHLQTINQLTENVMNSKDPFASDTLIMKRPLTCQNLK